MIYVENVRFWVPREAAYSLLALVKAQLCDGCADEAAPSIAVTVDLVTNNVAVTEATTFADLTFSEAGGGEGKVLNDETPPGYCVGMLEGPGLGGDGEWRLIMDQQIWTWTSGDPESIFGVALWANIDGEDVIVGYAQLATGPAAFGEVGDIIKLTGELVLLPQVPPPVEEVPEP